MIAATTLAQLLAQDPVAPLHQAIVTSLATLLPGVQVVRHPGKVDVSELIAKSVVRAPGIGVGWTKMRRNGISDGHYTILVDWIAYIVTEAKPISERRVEKEEIAIAIGNRLLMILSDRDAWRWGRSGVAMPEANAEMKPVFTVTDASQGTAYYAVTWSQSVMALGATHFPTVEGSANAELDQVDYLTEADVAEMDGWFARGPEGDDA